MITQNQLEPQSETKRGVKTPEGKQISKYNAIRHGILTQVLLPNETTEAEIIKEQLTNEYEPKTLTEELLIETMVIAYTRRQRATNTEREFMLQVLNPAIYEERSITPPLLENQPIGDSVSGIKEMILIKPAYTAKVAPEQIDIVDRTFARYITTCERQFFRALHELQRIQSIRKGLKPTSIAVDFTNEARNED